VPGQLSCPRTAPPAVTPSGPFVFEGYVVYANRARRSTSLISPPAGDAKSRLPGTWSDGGSDNASFSQDNRNVRLIAFDSAATNLIAADANARRDVFVVRRAHG